jgi:hypothetical protein
MDSAAGSRENRMSPLHPVYDNLVAPARARLDSDRRLNALMDPAIDRAHFHCCLMRWNAWRAQLTHPSHGWVRRAAERCIARGYPEVGRVLMLRGKRIADRHQALLDDLHGLVQGWNASGRPAVEAARFLEAPAPASLRRHLDLQESIIAGLEPFAQIAIEYEIDRASDILAPRLLKQGLRVLGHQAARGLAALRARISDQGQTTFSERHLTRLLAQHPQAAATLGITGAIALESHLDLLGDCLDHARRAAGTPGEPDQNADPLNDGYPTARSRRDGCR